MTRFLLVGNGRPLEEVCQAIPRLGGEVAGVYANPESARRLQAMGIDPQQSSILRAPEAAEVIRAQRIDWLLNVQSQVVFPAAVIRAPALGAINFHPGPLPEGAGLTAHEWAVILGESAFAATLHYMTPDLDAGPIIVRRDFEISDTDTGLTLLAHAWRVGTELLCDLLPSLIAGQRPSAYAQDKSKFRYFPGKPPHGGRIDVSWPADRILNFVRALQYYPLQSPSGPPRLVVNGEPFAVLQAERGESSSGHSPPGKITEVSERGVQIAVSGHESVWIIRLLREGSPVAAGPFFQRHGISAGALCDTELPASSGRP
ncbi:MAG: hypothetical protein A3G34_14365 [Candidatus Lindowbacteria bacterium RIFCSPLOWO2_12_FULL_62_27]|nr:MAG: hypothetical protein A3I06_16840 [Candidatus Lindowbacteria bacterium RIFCSPLOWO2_02_FULL_62_12]OGH62745.1 MAG: hypothetical protein A3G34_14365 [Candidatus Lindowbacteria bacterium RIFCSPLOWO2_12_FULL_62_27]